MPSHLQPSIIVDYNRNQYYYDNQIVYTQVMGIITFDKSAKKFILKAFGKGVNEEKYLVELDNPNQKVLTPDGESLKLENFAGIKKGSEVFIKSDIISLAKMAGDLVK